MTSTNIPEINQYLDVLRLDKSEKTFESYLYAINKLLHFEEIASFEDLKNVDQDVISDFQLKLKKSGLGNSTINTVMRPLKAMFNWMIERHKLDKNPLVGMKELKTPKREPAFLSEEEIETLINSLKKLEDKLIISMYITTGMRCSELINLKLNDFNGTHLKVIGKGDDERNLVLQPEIIELLWMYIEWRNKKFGNTYPNIFISSRKKPFVRGGILAKVKRGMRNAGFSEDRIDAIHTHSLRHTFTANLLEVADVYTAQRALGHKNLKTTTLYTHLRNSALDRAMLNQKSIFKKG